MNAANWLELMGNILQSVLFKHIQWKFLNIVMLICMTVINVIVTFCEVCIFIVVTRTRVFCLICTSEFPRAAGPRDEGVHIWPSHITCKVCTRMYVYCVIQ